MKVHKIIKQSISKFFKRNKKNLLRIMLSSLIACGVTKAINSYEVNEYEKAKYEKESTIEGKVNDFTDKISSKAVDGSIIAIGNNEDKTKTGYYFKDRVLYDGEDNVVDLTNDSRYLYLYGANVDAETFEKMNLRESKTEAIILSYSSITSDCLKYLPKSVSTLYLNHCDFLDNIDDLPKYCPNIQILGLNNTMVDSLDSVRKLPKLKILNASESLCIDEDIINYLRKNNIDTNVGQKDLDIQEKLKDITNSIIKDGMSDKEKVRAVCLYVLDNLEYNGDLQDESNAQPLKYALEIKSGVCVSFAYLTDALLKNAGVECYRVNNMDHSWNLVKVDGKYYYVDPTNIDLEGEQQMKLFEKFNLNGSYFANPETFRTGSVMTVAESELTVMPSEIKEDIASVSNTGYSYHLANDDVIELEMMKLMAMVGCLSQVFFATKDVANSCKKLRLKAN